MNEAELQQRISDLGEWFHNINLNGVQTAPNHFLGDYPSFKWKLLERAIPNDLRGMTVLDIGCNGGFYSIQMKRRGAERVVAIDHDPVYLAQACFAAEVSGVDIEFHEMDVYRVSELKEQFDLVLFMGVFYHLRHPLLALDLIHRHVARDLLLFQSLQRGDRSIAPVEEDYAFEETDVFHEPGYPVMHFVEHSYAHDPTNWWIPNRACVEAMLRSAGFEILNRPEDETYLCRKR